jgi:hypothetical protein
MAGLADRRNHQTSPDLPEPVLPGSPEGMLMVVEFGHLIERASAGDMAC